MDGTAYERSIDKFRHMAQSGTGIDGMVEHLFDEGLEIGSSIHVVARVYHISFGEAKRRVSSHPRWRSTADGMKDVHHYLIERLDGKSE